MRIHSNRIIFPKDRRSIFILCYDFNHYYFSGERMIVVHAGGTDGFIPESLLTFNYHDEMNSENFTR